MIAERADPRLRAPTWAAAPDDPIDQRRVRGQVRLLALTNAVAAAWYFVWLLQPARIGTPWLYGLLVVAEVYNLLQAAGFWWTASRQRTRTTIPADVLGAVSVDVLIPTYNEPLAVVEPTVAAATAIVGADVRVHLLDDGDRADMTSLAARHGVAYHRRAGNDGAKAGNINHALKATSAEFVAILDCDHVPDRALLTATLGQFVDPDLAYVQTPQYYANAAGGPVQAAAWAQQALFFGAIARGKDGLGAMFCCGTNVVFRRRALDDVGGFPTESVTEDFQLSIRLHERGWASAYLPRVLARGLGPEDMAAYTSQQQRWAQGCLSAIPATVRARLPWRLKLQYLLSAGFFLSGWTLLVYMALPVVAILTGALPLKGASADAYLVRFVPYWGLALATVAVAGQGCYSFGGFATWAATFWIHIQATVRALFRRAGGFVVTPKEGDLRRQPRAVAPALLVMAVLGVAVTAGLLRDRSPSTLNNAAFALVHLSVQAAGAWPALRRPLPRATDEDAATAHAGRNAEDLLPAAAAADGPPREPGSR